MSLCLSSAKSMHWGTGVGQESQDMCKTAVSPRVPNHMACAIDLTSIMRRKDTWWCTVAVLGERPEKLHDRTYTLAADVARYSM
jgi:hypothetical protein